MSLACIVNWLANFLVGLCFPMLRVALGPLCFVPFGVVLFLTFIFAWLYLPETQGRTVEEISRLCQNSESILEQADDVTIQELTQVLQMAKRDSIQRFSDLLHKTKRNSNERVKKATT
jgi:hypothetical protein